MIESPYDRDIIEMQGRINRTVIPYGSPKQRERVLQRGAQLYAAPASVASDMAGYLNKNAARAGGGEAITGDGDLVADVKAGRQDLSALKDEELPDSVRRVPRAERQAHLDQQAEERRALNGQLADLVKKRDQYVSDQRKKTPARAGDSFDRAVEKTLRTQIR